MMSLIYSGGLQFPTIASKRVKCRRPAEEEEHLSLIPGLPDHIAQFCLTFVPSSKLYAVCHSWRRLIYAPSFPPFLSLYALFESKDSNSLQLCSFDPFSCKWQHIPLPPPVGTTRRFLLHHPSFLSRKLPIQSVAVDGKIVILAATADQFQPALSSPLVFEPSTEKWSLGPSISSPRRWCAAGVSHSTVFVASGIGSRYNTDVARTVEKWDLSAQNQKLQVKVQPWRWEKMRNLKDGRFSREAIDAVGWRGKLCMVNVKGDAPKEGVIYDIETDSWEDMPEGMINGWRGPAAAMEEETIFVVNESKGSLGKYNHLDDSWVEVLENDMLKGAQQMAAGKGKVCVLCGDGAGIVVVDVKSPPPVSLWVVDAPPGFQGINLHILPRLSRPGIPTKGE